MSRARQETSTERILCSFCCFLSNVNCLSSRMFFQRKNKQPTKVLPLPFLVVHVCPLFFEVCVLGALLLPSCSLCVPLSPFPLLLLSVLLLYVGGVVCVSPVCYPYLSPIVCVFRLCAFWFLLCSCFCVDVCLKTC